MTAFATRPPASQSTLALIVAKFVAVCALVPYALVALGLRLLMARTFFVPGQSKIEGPVLHSPIPGAEFSIVLPAAIKDSTFQLFETQYAALPMPSAFATYLFTYAEFVLPICLVVGFATRVSALALLVLTVLIQVYVMPDAFWSIHVYWIAILMVLLSCGPGAISIDRVIRYVYEK